MDRTTSKSTLTPLTPPPLHSEDLGIDSTAPPSLETVTHLALLLHAAKAEYSYWHTRVRHLSTLLAEHKSALITSHSLSEAEAWELQLQADAEAQLLQDLDRETEMEVEAQLLGEAEERVEREAERQLLVEAGLVSEEDEGWRRVGITGRGKEGGMRKRRSLVRPRMSGSLGNEETKTELEKVDEAAEAVPGVNAVAELVPEAVKDVEVAQPSKAEEEVFEESHGKARWTRRRSLRRNMRTMGDLRGSARLRSLQDANASDCAVEGSHHHQEPTRRQSLPSLRRAEKEQEDYSRPPTPPQEKPETPPPPQQQQQPALHPEEPISPPPSPPLPPQQQEPHPQPIKPRAPFLTHAYTPQPRPRPRAIPPPSKDQHQPKDPRSNPPPPYNPPTPSHSTAFTRAQSILLDLKSPLKGFINTYPYISPRPIFTSPATLPTAPPPTNGAANARSENPPSMLAPEPISNPPPRRRAPADRGFLSAYETAAPLTPQKQPQAQAVPTPAKVRRLKRDTTCDNGHEAAGYAKILERRSSRRYVKDERWGWRAV